MKTFRVIPRLDIKGPNLVKGIHLEGLRVLGKPSDFAKFYYEQGADELIYMDVVASLYGRNGLKDLVRETAKEIFIPLTVGGGIRTTNDILEMLRSGADKVSINTAAIENPKFVEEAVKMFGSSTIVATIEAIKSSSGEYQAYFNNGREHTGKEVAAWSKELEAMGVGEIMITSVDREGTGNGPDQELIKKITSSVNIPVIAHGGISSGEDVRSIVEKTAIDAIAIASSFHYDALANHRFNSSSSAEGNTDFLKSGRAFTKVKQMNIKDLKNYLSGHGIACRI